MDFIYDLAIVGGGASGLAAAIAAGRAHSGIRAAVLEAQPRCGRKLLATGNGRCNITNRTADPSSYNSDSAEVVRRVFERVDEKNTEEFFLSLGLPLREESEGRTYPFCGQASAVLDLLRLALANLNIPELCGCRVDKISRDGGSSRYILHTTLGVVRAKCVIIACGGLAAPKLGGCKDGYELMRSLGHSQTKLTPSLAPIPVKSPNLSALKGVRISAEAALCDNSGKIYSDRGEVQFGDKALSGIVVFQLSSALAAMKRTDGVCVELDLLPDMSASEVELMLVERREIMRGAALENYLVGLFNKRVGICLIKDAVEARFSSDASSLDDEAVKRLAYVIKHWRFPVSGASSWDSAQVTCGGIRLSEINGDDMSSLKHKGLFAAGEMLNADGKCGGFNLQWAWSTGILAGRSAADYLIGSAKRELPQSK